MPHFQTHPCTYGMLWLSDMCVLYVHIYISLRDENRPHPGNLTERREAGLLGPTKSWLGSNAAVLGHKLGRTGAHLGPTWGVTSAELRPVGSNLGPTGVLCGASGAEVVPKTSPMWATRPRTGVCSVKSGSKLTDRSFGPLVSFAAKQTTMPWHLQCGRIFYCTTIIYNIPI